MNPGSKRVPRFNASATLTWAQTDKGRATLRKYMTPEDHERGIQTLMACAAGEKAIFSSCQHCNSMEETGVYIRIIGSSERWKERQSCVTIRCMNFPTASPE